MPVQDLAKPVDSIHDITPDLEQRHRDAMLDLILVWGALDIALGMLLSGAQGLPLEQGAGLGPKTPEPAIGGDRSRVPSPAGHTRYPRNSSRMASGIPVAVHGCPTAVDPGACGPQPRPGSRSLLTISRTNGNNRTYLDFH